MANSKVTFLQITFNIFKIVKPLFIKLKITWNLEILSVHGKIDTETPQVSIPAFIDHFCLRLLNLATVYFENYANDKTT